MSAVRFSICCLRESISVAISIIVCSVCSRRSPTSLSLAEDCSFTCSFSCDISTISVCSAILASFTRASSISHSFKFSVRICSISSNCTMRSLMALVSSSACSVRLSAAFRFSADRLVLSSNSCSSAATRACSSVFCEDRLSTFMQSSCAAPCLVTASSRICMSSLDLSSRASLSAMFNCLMVSV